MAAVAEHAKHTHTGPNKCIQAGLPRMGNHNGKLVSHCVGTTCGWHDTLRPILSARGPKSDEQAPGPRSHCPARPRGSTLLATAGSLLHRRSCFPLVVQPLSPGVRQQRCAQPAAPGASLSLATAAALQQNRALGSDAFVLLSRGIAGGQHAAVVCTVTSPATLMAPSPEA